MAHVPFAIPDDALEECAREPIHLPGSIQSFGTLVVFDEAYRVVQCAGNVAEFLEQPVEKVLGASLAWLLGGDMEKRVDAAIQGLPEGQIRHLGYLHLTKRELLFSVSVHLCDEVRILELVPVIQPDNASANLELALSLLHQSSLLLSERGSVETFCHHVALSVRQATGFDRVMVYRFDRDWHGLVLAEAKADDMETFLGLWFPASDIPPQARELYRRNRLRVLADVQSAPVPLVPQIHPRTHRPLDQSYCLLRNFSPVHREYLTNMDVAATLVGTITVRGQMWGLIACHHRQRRVPSVADRELVSICCELLGIQAAQFEDFECQRGEALAQRLLRHLPNIVQSHADWMSALIHPDAGIQAALAADGLAIVVGDRIAQADVTPPDEVIREITTWLESRQSDIFVTDWLELKAPQFAQYTNVASGVLAMRLPLPFEGWLIWFRRELSQTVTWAGNPLKGITTTGTGARLSPRKSFGTWLEVTRGRSRPWTATELALVGETIRPNLLNVLLVWKERELLRVRTQFDFLLGQLYDAAIFLDQRGVITHWNPAANRLLGLSAKEMLGTRALDSFPEKNRDQASKILDTVFQGEVFVTEWHFTRPDGSSIWLDTRAQLCHEPDAKPMGVVVVACDITERKNEQALREAAELQLQQARKLEAIGQLAGGVAHDFNNLLTIVTGYGNMLLDNLDPHHPDREALEAIVEAGERGTNLTNQLLAFGRKQMIRFETIDLNVSLIRMDNLLKRVLDPRLERITRASPQPCWVVADSNQVDQILLNLAINARDAMPNGGRLEFVVSPLELLKPDPKFPEAALGKYVCLSVKDDGCGMTEATKARIFEPFFTTKEMGKGTGLGLATVYGIVKQLQGHIAVASTVGVGTEFTILFPAALEGSIAPTPIREKVTYRGQESILLVEDDDSVRAFTASLLRQHGYTVHTATNGLHAMDAIQRLVEPPRLLVTDVVMPGINGVELASQIIALYPKIKVVFISGYHDNPVLRDGIAAQQVRFVHKPFHPDELARAIREMLDRNP